MTTPASDTADATIRGVTRADLLSVLRIERVSFPQPWPYAAFERFLDAPGFLVADTGTASPAVDADWGGSLPLGPGADEGVVGYVVADTVRAHGVPMGHVKDLAVHPDRRGEGIGRRLLERAVVTLQREGIEQVKLEVRESNERARRLYDQCGFVRRGVVPGYYEDGEDALILVRSVGPLPGRQD